MVLIQGTFLYLVQSVSTWKLFLISFLISPILILLKDFIETYIFHDWTLLIPLGLLWGMDNITGTWASIKEKDPITHKRRFDGRLWFYMNFEKTAAYILWIALFGILKSSVATKEWISNVIGNTAITVLIIREAISVGENILLVRPDKKMANIVNRMKNVFDVKKDS